MTSRDSNSPAKLYIGNLQWNISEDALRAQFQEIGAVSSVSIILDRETGRSRGFGFVQMENAEDAKKAIETLNGLNIAGRNIFVREARPEGVNMKFEEKLTQDIMNFVYDADAATEMLFDYEGKKFQLKRSA